MKSTVFFALFICLLLLSGIVFGQQNVTTAFERLINNSEQLYQQKAYNKAIHQAQLAFQEAEKNNNKRQAAIALNKEGHSLIRLKKRLKKNRKEAAEKFKQSLFYLTGIAHPSLRMDNLENLKLLAQQQKDNQQVVLYEKQIAEIKNLSIANKANEKLAEQVDSLMMQEEFLTDKVASLSAAQLKSELVIALQKHKVDSFAFKQTKDSFLLAQKELMLAQQSATMSLQESEIELQKSQRNLLIAIAAIIGFLALGALTRFLEMKKHNNVLEIKNQIIEAEKKRSDELLLNILPAIVAQELKTNGVAKAKRHEQATVLFSDFKNFSVIAKTLSPEELVYQLDFYFKAFDRIIGKYKLEKIKTIGDAYMCVGGLPEDRTGHTTDVIKAALDIQQYLEELKVERIKKGEPFFEARIGIHTGPLVAGVVGSKKFAYDIWGDTVNVAARLESNSEAGKVNVSSATYSLIQRTFECESRGEIPIKNMGKVGMYFVKGKVS